MSSELNPHGMPLDECLESIVQWTLKHISPDLFKIALEEFSATYGKLFSDDPFYQDRMNYFLELTILERPVGGIHGQKTLLELYLNHQDGIRLLQHKTWRCLSDFNHSIFEVMKEGSSEIIVTDLLEQRSFRVSPKKTETLQFMRKKNIFQGYLFSLDPNHYLGQGMIMHPPKARLQIMAYLKTVELSSLRSVGPILQRLAATNMRFLRMHHVDPAAIYAGNLQSAQK